MKTLNNETLAAIQGGRRVHRLSGWCAMLAFVAAFAVLIDALSAEMRMGPDRIDIVAGTETPLSGNVPIQDAKPEDFIVLGIDRAAPATLTLEGYFPSYWFGSGMWRAILDVPADTKPAIYPVVVAFRGGTPQSAQTFNIAVWASEDDIRLNSFSLCWRHFGLRPFHVSAVLGIAGLLLGLLNFILGRRYGNLLERKGISEIFITAPMGRGRVEAACGVLHGCDIQAGANADIFHPDGTHVCDAQVGKAENARVRFFLSEASGVRVGDLVQFSDESFGETSQNTARNADAG